MNIELRSYTLEDVSALATQANNYEVSKYLRDIFPYPYSPKDADAFINFVIKLPTNKGLEYVICVDGELAGAIGITFSTDIYRKTCELGYWLGEDYWGNGIASKAVSILVSHVFNQYPVHKITAEVFADNIGSIKVLEKNHFILEGTCKEHVYKNGSYQDIHLYGLCR